MLLLLALVAGASAAPQWLVPQYQYGDMYPGMYPAIADPRIQTAAAAATNPLQRGIIGIEALQAINGMFMEDATTTPAQVVTGTFSFTQNFATDLLFANNAQYKIYINSGSTLDLTGKNVMLGFGSDCATAATGTAVFATVNAPVQINGFWVTGATTGYNIDASNSKTSMKNMRLQVLDSTGALIGCSSAALT